MVKNFGIVALLLLFSGIAGAQSLNLDMDVAGAPPNLGGGAPSSTFGAVANQAGYWNAVSAPLFGNVQLRGLDGNFSSVMISGPLGGEGAGQNIPINTGDMALLLNDARTFDSFFGLDFMISGLQNGAYRLYTYAVALHTITEVMRSTVTVTEATFNSTQLVTGPMPGNQLIRGITHSEHDVLVTDGSLHVSIQAFDSTTGYFNGLQLVSVPEPSSIVGLSLLSLLLLRKRR
jgi:hypothetical protein